MITLLPVLLSAQLFKLFDCVLFFCHVMNYDVLELYWIGPLAVVQC